MLNPSLFTFAKTIVGRLWTRVVMVVLTFATFSVTAAAQPSVNSTNPLPTNLTVWTSLTPGTLGQVAKKLFAQPGAQYIQGAAERQAQVYLVDANAYVAAEGQVDYLKKLLNKGYIVVIDSDGSAEGQKKVATLSQKMVGVAFESVAVQLYQAHEGSEGAAHAYTLSAEEIPDYVGLLVHMRPRAAE